MSKIVDILLPRDVAEYLAQINGHGNTGDLAGLITLEAHLIESGHHRVSGAPWDISDGVLIPINAEQAPLLRGTSQLGQENLDLPPIGQGALAAANNLLAHIQSQINTNGINTQLEVPLNNGFFVRFIPDDRPIAFRRD